MSYKKAFGWGMLFAPFVPLYVIFCMEFGWKLALMPFVFGAIVVVWMATATWLLTK